MPESSASIALGDLQSALGFELGYGRGADEGDAAWDTRQQAAIDTCIVSGLHRFYYPPVLPGEKNAHEWSFLKPTSTVFLAEGASAVELPADFGGLSGEVTLSSPEAQRIDRVAVIGIGLLDQYVAQSDDLTGVPEYVAIRPKRGTGADRGQRFELAVYPTADADYEFKIAYTVVPGVLTAANPYPYGGPVHRETILESCLAVAESRIDSRLDQHKALFMEQLKASVSHDRKYRPQVLGYNGNRSGGQDKRYDGRLITNDSLYST